MCRLLDYCPSRAYVGGKAHRRGQYRFGSVTCHTGPQWPVPVTWLCMWLRSLTTGTTKRPSGVELLNDSFTTPFVELHRCPADPSERAHNLNCAFKRCLYCRRGRNVALQYESFESPCSPNTATFAKQRNYCNYRVECASHLVENKGETFSYAL